MARFRGGAPLAVLLNALMGLPPVVVGLLVYLLLSRSGPLGALGLLFTPGAMVLAQTLLVMPIVAALTRQTVADLHDEYGEQLRSLGAGRLHATATLLFEGRFSLATALLAGFGRAIAEVGAVIIVGGNIAHATRTMTTAIALETSRGDLAARPRPRRPARRPRARRERERGARVSRRRDVLPAEREGILPLAFEAVGYEVARRPAPRGRVASCSAPGRAA